MKNKCHLFLHRCWFDKYRKINSLTLKFVVKIFANFL
ncbi:MAG: hypothetical protein HC803_07050 [Saprospiraceae bacterium]|nr:hypothetical protein [Saprospiraceae bacterium]